MPNQLNKNKNKLKDKDEIRIAQGNLILAQQAERRRRFQRIVDGNRSAEEFLEETRQRVELVEEAREELLNLCSLREENPDGREATHMARSAERARAWSDLFVQDTLLPGTTSEDPSSPRFAAVETASVREKAAGVGEQTAGVGEKAAGVGEQTAGVGVQIAGAGVQTAGAGVQTTGVGVQSHGVGVNNASVTGPNNACLQNLVLMAGQKEKLPKFNGDGTADPIRHCKTCEMIWRANGITDEDDWMRQFLTTLQGVVIDWFTSTDPQKLNSWNNIKKEFLTEFQLLRDDNEIVGEIFNTKQGKNETIHIYAKKLKDLINKMENKPADGLQRRWFVEGLRPKLQKEMKIVLPLSYTKAYNRALNLESEQKTKKKKNSFSDSDADESSEEDTSDDENSSKKVRALQKDMIHMMEFKNMQETKGNELWCTECKTDGHTKGSCPKKPILRHLSDHGPFDKGMPL